MPHPFATHVGVRRLLTAAIAAPSVHNTQPWRFRLDGPVLELHADPDRRLDVIDPAGRNLHISCGAALMNLRLAIRTTGHRALVSPFPDGTDGTTLLATVRAVPAPMPSLVEAELYDRIPRRRTNRRPFSRRMVPEAVRAELAAAARVEGAMLDLPDPQTTAYLLSLLSTADERLASDAGYLDELEHWTSMRARGDGVPRYAFGPRPTGRGVRVRDFGPTGPAGDRGTDHFAVRPQLGVLRTGDDTPPGWLRTGQALQRVLLTAERYRVSSSLLFQPLDMCGTRTTDRSPGHIQAIIRFGYGPPVPGTPRRPYPEVLTRSRRELTDV